MSARDDTRELRRRLSVRFGKASGAVPMPEYAVLFEVPVDGVKRWSWETASGNTGASEKRVRRRIDAVAVGLWRSTNHLVHGFELKVTRADLVKELRDPDKSEPARRLCDRWWLVLSDLKLLGDDAPPDGWGVLHVRGRGLTAAAQPAAIQAERDPRFVAALLQSALVGRGTATRGLARIDGYTDGYQRGLRHGQRSGHSAGWSQGYEEGRIQFGATA